MTLKELEYRAADLAWEINEGLVGSATYHAILKALNRTYRDGHHDGRDEQLQSHSDSLGHQITK